MKNSKKLTILGLSAATALVAATGAVSSFAWFAANSNVSATGMIVKANATASYLQIKSANQKFHSGDSDVDDNWNNTQSDYKSAAADVGNGVLSPTSLVKSIASDKKSTEAWEKGQDPKWAYATSDKVTSPDRKSDYEDKTDVANTAGNNGFTLLNEFDLRIRPVSTGEIQTKAGALTASVAWAGATPTDALAKAVRVFVYNATAGDNKTGVLFSYANGTAWTTSTEKLADEMVGGATDKRIKVYVFFDGEDKNCFSNNVDINVSYSVTVNFAVAAAA